RPDGTAYSSGTGYEFETALEGFRTNRWPDLLVYRRDEIPLFPVSELQPEIEDGASSHSPSTIRLSSRNLLGPPT
ncbi:MAG: hypothetical protein WBZ19_11530, partial [Chthoniobacterales bacterium]